MKRIITTYLSLLICGISYAQYFNDFTSDPSPSITGSAGSAAFTNTSNGTDWTITASGHDEWEYLVLDLGGAMNFQTNGLLPEVSIVMSTTQTVVVTVLLEDINGRQTDALIEQSIKPFFFEVDQAGGSQTFTHDFSHQFNDIHGSPTGGAQGAVDSTQIVKVRFKINIGFGSAPYVGNLQTYNTSLGSAGNSQTLTIESLTIGSVATGVDMYEHIDFNVYPNPVHDVLSFSYESPEPSQIIINDVLGNHVKTVNANDLIRTMDLSDLQEGLYIANLVIDGVIRESKRIVKQ